MSPPHPSTPHPFSGSGWAQRGQAVPVPEKWQIAGGVRRADGLEPLGVVRVAERGRQPAVESQEVHALRRPAGEVLAEQRREEAPPAVCCVDFRMVCAAGAGR